jgi:serine/threonine protein kinase
MTKMAASLEGAARYLVHHRLGAGGMGEVHLGSMVTPAGTRSVALKQLTARSQANPDAAERMVAEARLVFQLTHANVCQVLDLATSEHGTFIVMEHVDGCDLRTLIRRRAETEGPVPLEAALFIAREIARALDYAHRRRDPTGRALFLVHGDVTPQNVLLSREGEVKLADFGIARVLGQVGLLGPGNQITGGTPGYIAPEAETGVLDLRADVYALGVTLYAAATGANPAHGIDPDRIAALPVEVRTILSRATAPRPDDRYGTAAAVEQELSLVLARRFPAFTASQLARLVEKYADVPARVNGAPSHTLVSLTGTALPDPDAARLAPGLGAGTRPVAPPRRRRPLLFTSAALALCAVAAAAAWHWRHPAAVSTATSLSPPPQVAPAELPSPTPSTGASARAEGATITPPPAARPSAVATQPKPSRPPRRSRPPEHRAVADAPGAPTEMGYLTVNSEPWGMVYVDGRRISELTPLYRAPLAAGAHRVTVYSPDKRAYSSPQAVVIRPGENRVLGFRW